MLETSLPLVNILQLCTEEDCERGERGERARGERRRRKSHVQRGSEEIDNY